MPTALRLATLGLLTGCFPEAYPPWVIDHPMAWGIIATVVERGGYSSEIVVPEGHLRATALPLDTLELEWLVVAPPGTELPPPIWIVCGDFCTELPEPTCPDPLPLSRTRSCRLGEGERIRLSLGGTFTAGDYFLGTISLLAVGSGDPDLDPETCLQRFSTVPREGLESCLIQTRTLTLGPPWVMFTAIPEFAARFTIYEGALEDLADDPPDTHPIVSAIHVTRASGGNVIETFASDGDTIHVRAGERITVTPIYTEDSRQERHFYQWSPDGNVFVSSRPPEQIYFRAALTGLVDGYDLLSDEGYRQWIAPDDPEPIILYLYIADSRQGRTQATLTFITDPGDAAAP